MRNTTRTAILAILASDDTINAKNIDGAILALEGGQERNVGRVIRPKEAARILGVTTKTTRTWADSGALVRVCAPNSKRAIGYTESSVRAIAEGGVA